MPAIGQRKRLVIRNQAGIVVVEMDGQWTGVPGLFITVLPDEPTVFTITHICGLRLGGRFDSFEDAVAQMHAHDHGSVSKIRWAQPPAELRLDKAAEIWMWSFRNKWQ